MALKQNINPLSGNFDLTNKEKGVVDTTPITESGTLELSNADQYLQVNSATAVDITIPPNSSVAFAIGTEITFEQIGLGEINFVEGSGVTINSYEASDSTAGQYATATLKKTDTDTWNLTGVIY